MKISSGDVGGYRLDLTSVTGAAHSELTHMTDAGEHVAIVGRLGDMLRALLATAVHPTADPSDERRALQTENGS